MFAKFLVYVSGVILGGVLGLSPTPNTPFLDSFQKATPPPSVDTTVTGDASGPEAETASTHEPDESKVSAVENSAEESSAGKSNAEDEQVLSVVNSDQTNLGLAAQPQVEAMDETLVPPPEFSPGVIGTFRLRCGHRAELHLSPRDGTFHILAMHGRNWKTYPVELAIGGQLSGGRAVLRLSNGTALWWVDNRYSLLLPRGQAAALQRP